MRIWFEVAEDDGHGEMIDRIIDEALEAGHVPEPPDGLRAEVELQVRIDQALRAGFRPPAEVVDVRSIRVDRVIDDTIDHGQEAAADDDLAEEVRLQRHVDAALRRQLAPDESSLVIKRQRRLPMLLIAASIFVIVGAAAMVMLLQPRPDDLTKLYIAHVDSGFIQFPCETPDQFQAWMEDNFEHSIRPQASAEDLVYRGWNYDAPISRYTGVMLGVARGEDVVVLVDHLDRDVELATPNEGLNLFRRTVGELVFYELTPLDEPVFIPTFEVVE